MPNEQQGVCHGAVAAWAIWKQSVQFSSHTKTDENPAVEPTKYKLYYSNSKYI